MEDDEDDFFARQAAKSLNNKRTQLKEFFQAATICQRRSSSSESESEEEIAVTTKRKMPLVSSEKKPVEAKIVCKETTVDKKSLIKIQIESIVDSCLTKQSKANGRKIKLGKRTAADDCDDEKQDELVDQLSQASSRTQRSALKSLNRSQIVEEEELVTRETAAYDRLDAVLRLTKTISESKDLLQDDSDDENSDY